MNGQIDDCQVFRDQLDAIEASIEALQEELGEASPSQKPAIVARIRALGRQAGLVERQLEECLRRPTSNLAIVGIERTQATQFFRFNGQGSGAAADNSVALVAQRATVLRIYVNKTSFGQFPAPGNISGTVSYAGRSSGPLNGPIASMPASAIDRGNPNHTLNFMIPAAACVGTVGFTVTVFDASHPNEVGYTSKSMSVTLSFGAVPQVRVHGVLIHYTGRGMDIAAPSGLDLVDTLAWVARVYPISGFTYTACEVIDFGGDLTVGGGGGCGAGWNDLFGQLWNMRVASGTNDVFVGLLPTGTPTGGVIGCGGGGVAIAYVGDGPTLSQEVGHAFGRAHAPCGNPGGPDPNYPVYDAYPSGSIGEFGFDTLASQVWNPASTFDFMSYCGPVWTSPYTYDGLRNGIIASMAATHPHRPHVRDVVREHVALNFRLHRDGRVELLPSFHLEIPAPPAEAGMPTPVGCDLLDAEGGILESHSCSLVDPHQDEHGPYLDFHEVLPWDSATRSIAVRRHGEVLRTVDVPAEPPKVTVRQPKRVERREELMRVEWTGSHPQQPVTYLLRYSHDGGASWRAVAADLTGTRHVVNLDLLPGGDACKFQVVASAGVQTAVAETDPFAVPRKPYQAHIITPQSGAEYQQGEPVALQGGGFSPDLETTAFEEATWASSLDGPLGTGYQVVVHTLSVGRHKLTLTIPDGYGGEATGSVFVTVIPRS
jgi:hypothetical protein